MNEYIYLIDITDPEKELCIFPMIAIDQFFISNDPNFSICFRKEIFGQNIKYYSIIESENFYKKNKKEITYDSYNSANKLGTYDIMSVKYFVNDNISIKKYYQPKSKHYILKSKNGKFDFNNKNFKFLLDISKNLQYKDKYICQYGFPIF